MSQQQQRCLRANKLINFVIDIQGFRSSKGGFLPKEVAVLSLNGSILGNWMLKASQDFDTLPNDIKTTNNYCTLNLHGIEWYDGEVALKAVRSQLRKLGRQARTIFVRGYDKAKYLESLLGRRIVNLEDYNTSVKYDELERQFGGGLYCTIHGLQEHTENRIYCALNRVYLLKKWLQTILDEYNRDRPDFAQEDDYHSGLWHTEAKNTERCRIAMNQLDIDNEYPLDEDKDDYDDNDDYADDDDDDSENPYEIPGKPVTSSIEATSPIDMTSKDAAYDKEETTILNETTTPNKSEIISTNVTMMNVDDKTTPIKEQVSDDDEQMNTTPQPSQLSKLDKNRIDGDVVSHSRFKRRIESCCSCVRYKQFYESDDGRDVVDGLTTIS